MRRTETPKPIWIKFCAVVDIVDAVTYTNFGDHRLRGFWMAGGQISPSPIDFNRRPYNTLALPCECVMITGKAHYAAQRSVATLVNNDDFCRTAYEISEFARLCQKSHRN